jgi:hypothetical protein
MQQGKIKKYQTITYEPYLNNFSTSNDYKILTL